MKCSSAGNLRTADSESVNQTCSFTGSKPKTRSKFGKTAGKFAGVESWFVQTSRVEFLVKCLRNLVGNSEKSA